MSDTIVKCVWCGREERVGFGSSLRSGWPTCCRGHTMRLLATNADIAAATVAVLPAKSKEKE